MSWSVITIACLASRAASVEIEVGYAEALPGQDAIVDVVLHSEGAQVAGTQNDIAFEPEAQIPANQKGDPDCWVNPAIDKSATVFVFPPFGCTPFDQSYCDAFRTLVIAFDNVAPIPDGAVLYSCRVSLAANAPAVERRLLCFNAGSASPDGDALATSCRDGGVLPPGATPGPTRTPAPDPLRLAGEPCERDDQCASGACTDGTCCIAGCGGDEKCVDGRLCLPRCENDSDCGPHGPCLQGACYDLGDATPGGGRPVGVPVIGTPEAGPLTGTTGASAGGGCTIGPPAGGAAWWLLWVLPCALLLVRCAQGHKSP